MFPACSWKAVSLLFVHGCCRKSMYIEALVFSAITHRKNLKLPYIVRQVVKQVFSSGSVRDHM